MNAIGVDVGGTKVAAGVVSSEGKLLSRVRHPTIHSAGELIECIARAVREAREGYEVGSVCLAVPGLIMSRENHVVFSPNLRVVEGIPLKEELEGRTGLNVTVENDANAAAWGEFSFGAGRDVQHLIFVTLGTGVGGGVIVGGELLEGAQGAGGEIGHTTIQATGPRCTCGNRGCLEALASGTAIERRATQLARKYRDSKLAALAKDGISGEGITELAHEGDELAVSVLREAGVWLGIALASFTNLFNPEVIAVGGGAAAAGELILGPARREIQLRARSPSRDLVEVRPATLGEESGILGAAALARDGGGESVLGS